MNSVVCNDKQIVLTKGFINFCKHINKKYFCSIITTKQYLDPDSLYSVMKSDTINFILEESSAIQLYEAYKKEIHSMTSKIVHHDMDSI